MNYFKTRLLEFYIGNIGRVKEYLKQGKIYPDMLLDWYKK